MSRFHFSLQRILDLRASAERLQAMIMQRAAAAEGERRQASEASAAGLDRVQEQTREVTSAPAGLLRAYELSAEAARARLEQDADKLREAEALHLAQQERFTSARMARRSLERLRERQAEDWTFEAARGEQALSDEIARQGSAGEEEE